MFYFYIMFSPYLVNFMVQMKCDCLFLLFSIVSKDIWWVGFSVSLLILSCPSFNTSTPFPQLIWQVRTRANDLSIDFVWKISGVLLVVPLYLAITPMRVLQDPLVGQECRSMFEEGEVDDRFLMILFLMVERLRENSSWKPYV